jgi:DNA transformation protein and related proteins
VPREDEFCDHVADLLSPLGKITYRRMFGGFGIYVDGRIVAIADDGVLYLKADDENRPGFEAAGMEPFRPFPDRDTAMSYYQVPAEALDDQDRLIGLARTSLEAAQRSAARQAD